MRTAFGTRKTGLLLTIVVVQALYWGLLSPYFSPTKRPVDRLEQTSFEVASVSSPDWQTVAAAHFQEVEYPWSDCCEAGYRAARIRFDLDAVPANGLAEIPVIGADNYETRLNGFLIWGEGSMALPNPSYHGREYRGINRLPAGLLKVGTNELVYTLVRAEGGGEFFIARPTLGQYKPMVSYFAMTRFKLNDYISISITVGYLIAFIAMVAWWRGYREPYLFWMAVLAVAWAGMLHLDEIVYPFLSGSGTAILSAILIMVVPLAWINLVNSWGGAPVRWVRKVSIALFGLAASLSVLSIILKPFADTISPDRVAFWFSLIAALAVAVLILRKLASNQGQDQIWEMALFLLCATILVRDALGEVYDLLNYGSSTDLVLPFLLVGLMAAFLARNIRLFRSQGQIAGLLQTQLDERTAQLELAHARETELVREQAHDEERRRIMRDMHDGLGSNLMSMLLAARRGIAEPETVAEGLQSVVDEMRLMIDSMDSVGESLATALATFRGRVADRVTGAGFRLDWQDGATRPLPNYSPRAVLQVFRVMQEAVTNALKHSGGDTIAITIADGASASERLAITIADNGAGTLGAGNSRGRGLDNMRSRASSIGAQITFVESACGLAVRLDLPGTTEIAA